MIERGHLRLSVKAKSTTDSYPLHFATTKQTYIPGGGNQPVLLGESPNL